MDIGTLVTVAVAKDTVVDIFKCRQWYPLDDRGGKARQQQENKSDQQQNGERGRWLEQHGEEKAKATPSG
jgi:hypothetical protein